MKQLVVLLFFVATVCSAYVSLKVSQNSEYRAKIEIPEKLDKANIVAEETAMKYVDRFSEAINSLIRSSNKEENLSYLLLFGITSLILIIISNILFKQGYDGPATIFAILTAASILVATLVTVSITVAIALIFAATLVVIVLAFVVLAFAVDATIINKKKYKIFSEICYILIVILFVLLFV